MSKYLLQCLTFSQNLSAVREVLRCDCFSCHILAVAELYRFKAIWSLTLTLTKKDLPAELACHDRSRAISVPNGRSNLHKDFRSHDR